MTVSDHAVPEGPGSASGAPNLPEGFTDTFTSRYVDTGDLRQHAVIGGEGPPLLLVHGWPQTWYQYRLVMPALARDFEVIAVDQRGIGPVNERIWHIAFNRLAGNVNEELVRGREDIFIGAEYATWAGTPLPDAVVKYYVDRLASDPEALRGRFEFYRALDTDFAQSEQRKTQRLTMPVLVIGGAASVGDEVANTMKLVTDDVQSVVIPGSGHWVAEEAPDEFLAALTEFLSPYRAGGGGLR